MRGFATYISPLGLLGIQSESGAITRVSFEEEKQKEVLTPEIERTQIQLSEYFDGKRQQFDLSLNPSGTDFQQSVWQVLMMIPFGKTTSYSAIARELGDIAKVRAVGTANGTNPIAIIVPCHRVIGVDGNLVGYAGGLERKEWLLRHEGSAIFDQTELFKK